MTAYFDEQRREQAEAGVHFLLVTYSLGKQRKVTRRKGEKTFPKNPQYSNLAIQNLLQQNNPINLPQSKRRLTQFAPF